MPIASNSSILSLFVLENKNAKRSTIRTKWEQNVYSSFPVILGYNIEEVARNILI